jgi:hypothetical protein
MPVCIITEGSVKPIKEIIPPRIPPLIVPIPIPTWLLAGPDYYHLEDQLPT